MDDLDNRLRQTNPYPTRVDDAPLDPRAEADLAVLLGNGAAAPPISLDSRRRRWIVPAAAAATVLALATGVGLASQAAHRSEELTLLAAASVAEPVVSPSAGHGSKEQSLRQAFQASAQTPAGPTSRDLTVTHWELGTMWDTTQQEFTHEIALPMTYELSTDPDDTVRQKIAAGYPLGQWNDQATLDDLETNGLRPGETSTNSYPAADFDPMFPGTPPSTADTMLDYLTGVQESNRAAIADGDQGLLQTTGMMLMWWHLSPEANEAILRVIAGNPNIEYTGETVDREGNAVSTYSLETESNGTYRTSLLVNAETGRVSGYEEAYISGPADGTPDFQIPSVLRYIQVHEQTDTAA